MTKIGGLTLALKRIPSAAYLYAVIGVALVGGYNIFVHQQREIGKRDSLIANAERTNAELRRAQDSLAKQYGVDTIWRRVTKTRVDTMATTVEVWKHDTLRVVEFVARADTAAKACTQALLTCDQKVAIATKGWDNARAEIAKIKSAQPSKARPWIYGAAGAGLGYLAGRIK